MILDMITFKSSTQHNPFLISVPPAQIVQKLALHIKLALKSNESFDMSPFKIINLLYNFFIKDLLWQRLVAVQKAR